MRRVLHPSREAIEQAYQFGQKVAFTDRQLVPQVHFIREFRRFQQYLEAHRYCLEQARVFGHWDEQLRQLIDSEGRRQGFNLNDSLHWDHFYQYIAVPMRASFWFGWESAWGLPRIHEKWWKAHTARIAAPPREKRKDQPAHHFYAGVNVSVPGEKDSWEAITNKLFEQQLGKDDDEDFWVLPEAGQIAQKANASEQLL